MRNARLKLGFLLLCIFLGNSINAQNKKSNSQIENEKDSSYVSVDVNFISDAVFMGRKDSISAPYVYPSMTYHHKSGFYTTGSFSYLTKSNESRIDLFIITAGFDFSIKKLFGDISVTKYMFNDDSYTVISEVEADVTASFKYDFDIINLAVTANTYFNSGSNSDFFLSSEISHDFISKNEKFQISPTAGIYFGSQNFYEDYYINNRLGNGRGQGEGSDDVNQSTTNIAIQESEKFNMMAIEFSIPMWYVHKSFTVSFLPAYVIPQNPATLIIDETLFEENIDKTFYWMLGFGYRF
ncbi:protein of unknown function (Gcw_chp) [Formosa sp. Hel1_31_208]|uniref:TorF family putative porin n=1 Tax=Formosa sp. Hel1_31_208 TaxID=1798225 RepID=UPI00087D553A|nr:TorF family putative porin [Formosa sp. Hel1_31_208]SDS19444.1 protein of unknown function (Gcw_chp) [Formosa sp. Hel1_31_208]